MLMAIVLLVVLAAGLWFLARRNDALGPLPSAVPAVRSQPAEHAGVQFCRNPWFNPQSANDWKVTGSQKPEPFAEVDSPSNLSKVMEPEFEPYNRFVIYQQWGPESADGSRTYFWLNKQSAEELARRLAVSPVQSLILVCTTFEPGALRSFADGLAALRKPDGGTSLKMLGVFWYFSGDTAEDSPEVLDDAAYAANKLGLSRLSMLSGAFPADAEQRLMNSLKGNTTLKWFGAFTRDEAMSWPAFPMPQLEALVSANRRG